MSPLQIASFASLAALPLLTGCISQQEMALRHKAACTSYGFSEGTESYSNCLLQLDVGDSGSGHHGRGRILRHGHPGASIPQTGMPSSGS